MSATQTDVLNPTLYRALSRVFGEVRVSHAGESFEARVAADLETDRPRLTVVRHGESYRVCCPFCRDRSFNLNVNHRYGTFDDRLDRPLDFLAVCFARGCLKDSSRRRSLFARLDGGLDILSGARLRSGERAAAEPQQLPRGFRHLGRFGDDHPVPARLRDHGFEPHALGREFGVGFCAGFRERLARDRVVAPVSQGGKFVGWIAARFIEGGVNFLSAPGMRAGEVVYNLDRAREYSAAVIVPSPDWVWRLGGPSVAPLTAPATDRFARTLMSVFRRKHVALVTPVGCEEDESLAKRLLARLGPAFTAVRLPRSLENAGRKELRQAVRAAAGERGLTVKFKSPTL